MIRVLHRCNTLQMLKYLVLGNTYQGFQTGPITVSTSNFLFNKSNSNCIRTKPCDVQNRISFFSLLLR